MKMYRATSGRNNRSLRWRRRLCWALAISLPASGFCAGQFADWAYRQTLQIQSPGLAKVPLPTITLDRARADFGDLRLTDDNDNETPYLIERPRPVGETRRDAAAFRSILQPAATVLMIETGTTDPVQGVSLLTPAGGFIKAVQVEGSQEADEWVLLATGLPLFRQAQSREEQLDLSLPVGSWRYLRLTIDDRGSARVPFTMAQLHIAPTDAPPAIPVEVRLLAREEVPGETRLTLDLGAAHIPLAEIELKTPDRFFRRPVRLIARQVEGITIQERELARGMIARGGSDAEAGSNRLRLPLDHVISGRELLLLIGNGDSPPLQVTEIRARRWPVHLVFWATPPGRYTIYTGNPVCRSPEYTLPIQGLELNRTPVMPVELSPPSANPNHESSVILPEVEEFAGQLDLSDWSFRKPVSIETAGIQQLELDLDVLAHAQPGQADLRLMLGDRQVPYILERRSVLQPLTPIVGIADDPDQPRIGRWLIQLPFANLPVTRLTCVSSTALFRREMILYELATDSRGRKYRHELGRAIWVQAPDRTGSSFNLDLRETPVTEALFLETDNADNPRLQLSDFELGYPRVRLFFKSMPGKDLYLYYGNAGAALPSYDLSLVAGQMIAAGKVPARLGAAERLRTGIWGENRVPGEGGVLFWGVLVVVVAGLLFLIARLVPKPNVPPPPKSK